MPRSLVSFWKRVATSGTTADGREILPQELRDIAETYKPSKYTAVIWCDHERWSGSHGTVYAVRLVEEGDDLEEGQIALEAQLKPNDRLLYLNDQGQKLFTSIEITPNFAGSGKAYLSGLAVTDEPASLGTQELYFSKKTNQTAYYAASVELGSLRDTQPQGELQKLITAFTGLFKRFGIEEIPANPQSPTESKPPMDEATAKAIQALIEQQLIVTAGLQALVDGFAEVVPEIDDEPVDDVQSAVDVIIATAEEEKNLSRNSGNKAVLAGLAKLQKQFTALQNTPSGRQLPRTSGPVTTAKKRVL
ncbi:GPO family capsid scaffolding protein [Pseudomonas sp. EA_65y_Pfl2_P78]|uniref:GPO family capsid scaffolding protein n=1 Tax=Pseudomonas sp. EA_65y_Pfl2_P78 TaxID=3088695 RepID=UPI0030DBF7F7